MCLINIIHLILTPVWDSMFTPLLRETRQIWERPCLGCSVIGVLLLQLYDLLLLSTYPQPNGNNKNLKVITLKFVTEIEIKNFPVPLNKQAMVVQLAG